MTRYVHTPLTSGFSSQSAIEQNFEDIEASLANTLSRTLESPNMMQAVLDMNSNRIINLPTPTSATEPVTYGMFVSSSVAPVYAGTVKESFTATAGQAVFTLITAYVPGANNLNVFINGLKQSSTAYTETNSTTVTFASGLEVGDLAEFINHERVTSSDVVTATNTTYSGVLGASNVSTSLSNAETNITTISTWKNADTLALNALQNLSIDGVYNAGYVKIGAYYVWQDVLGSLRFKLTAPTTAVDGVVFASALQGSTTYDPLSLADGVGATTTVAVTGAELGDYAQASFSLDTSGITISAWVSSVNTVSVRFQNESGGLLDIGSGTLRTKVTKV